MAKAKGITEAQWQAQVLGLAGFYGWRSYHPPDNRPGKSGRPQRVTAGFPDLVLVRAPELIIAELKTDTGRLGPGQQEWLDELERVADAFRRQAYAPDTETAGQPQPRIDIYLWRPADWEAVSARLARGRQEQRPTWAP